MNYQEATHLLFEWTQGESLRRHARTVEFVMVAYAEKLHQNKEQWAIAGLLHDADYEAFPTEHPNKIVGLLRSHGEEEIAYAISAHYTKWNVPYLSLLDKALLACDEITGFIVACVQIRPEGINTLTTESIIKKLKQKSFAASVDRSEVYKGAELFEVDLNEHIGFIIDVLQKNKEVLKIN